MKDQTEDFPYRAHHLNRWFGLKNFVIIALNDPNATINADEASMLMSCVSIVYNNAASTPIIPKHPGDSPVPKLLQSVPVFIPVGNRVKGTYVGWFLGTMGTGSHDAPISMRLDSDTGSAPRKITTIDDLLLIFESRLGFSRGEYDTVKDKTSISACYTFILQGLEWEATYPHMKMDTPSPARGRKVVRRRNPPLKLNHNDLVSFLPPSDPIDGLHLAIQWYAPALKSLDCGIPLDEEFVPMAAPNWSLRSIPSEDGGTYSLVGKWIREMIIENSTNSHPENQPLVSATNFPTMSLGVQLLEGVPTPDEIDFVFRKIMKPDSENVQLESNLKFEDFNLKGAFDVEPLVSLALFLVKYPSIRASALVWKEFVKELRWHWENRVPIPNVPRSDEQAINYKYSIIAQKLQLLNFCIERESTKKKTSTTPASNSQVESSQDSQTSTPVQVENSTQLEESSSKEWEDWEKGDSWSDDDLQLESDDEISTGIPSDMKLLGTETPLIIPKLQPEGAMTEDMVVEQQEIMSKFGTDAEGQKKRAQLQSVGLENDMSAFKEANPKGSFSDFVRWHSPRDWEQDKLSMRMIQPGNLWENLWEKSVPMASHKQKKIFQAEMEAEKILHFMDTIPISQFVFQ
eukprot:TRINITY_DN3880_c2_g1_i2.p1 TRINITY_DN3880_c2_g1~~TRINITY_DN3880_c2_g1_i2.p1  ORF type:complete len:735 (+),score=259.26 TRINITY_DN3880_c2_g1_i2:318-2207(+)